MTGTSGGQWRTTPDTAPQASQATRQARRVASWLRDEEAEVTRALRVPKRGENQRH